MTFWVTFFLWAATFVVADYFRQRLPSQTPSGIGDFTVPTATEGRFAPLCFGTMVIEGPNVLWYGDFEAEELTVSTGVIFKDDETVGYKYKFGMQLGLIRGQTAGLRRIWIGDDVVWDYTVDNGSVLGDVCDINKPNLFGGERQGGGFVGRFRLFDGTQAAVSTYLDTYGDITNLPAYIGFSYLVLTNLTEDGGAEIGESNSLRRMKFEIQTYDTVANGGLGDSMGLANDHHFIGDDLNPVSLAWDVFTNSDWGRGMSASDLNKTNFEAAAETIWTEGYGFSLVIDQVQTSAQLLDLIEHHIDGYIGPNPLTGQIEVNLARQDYTLAAEYQADETNVISVEKFSRGENNQTFNEVRVQYLDRDKNYGDTYAPAQDLANLAIQGRRRSRINRMPGVHTADIASKIAWRDLRGASRSLASATVELNRSAWNLRPGDIISLTDEEVGVTNLPCRVTSIRQGNPVNASILADVVEDVFGNEEAGIPAPPDTEFVPPSTVAAPLAANEQLAIEAPRIINKNDPSFPDNYPRLFTAAYSVPAPVSYDIAVDQSAASSPTGFDIEGTGTGSCVVGVLRNAETGWQDGNGTLTIDVDPIVGDLDDLIGILAPGGVGSLSGVAVINPGTANEEWVVFTEIIDNVTSPESSSITLSGVYRGALDTGMNDHSAGERIWFIWTGGTAIADTEFPVNQTLDVKLLPTTATDQINLTDSPEPPSAPLITLDVDERYAKPLLPVALGINDVNFNATPDADVFHTGFSPVVQGLKLAPTMRNWRTLNVVHSAQGLSDGPAAFTPAEVTGDQLRLSYWLYNLDDAGSPADDRSKAIVTSEDNVLSTAEEILFIARQAIRDGGVVADFNARLEIETSHAPAGLGGTLSPQWRYSYDVMMHDFFVTGTWVDATFAYSEVSYHSHFDILSPNDVAIDNSDHAHVATFAGNAFIDATQSKFGGGSLRLDGTGDYITVPSHTSLDFGVSDFTIEGQVYFNSLTGAQELLSWSTGTTQASIYKGSGENFLSYQHNSIDRADTSAFSPELVAGQWYHFAVSRASGVERLFLEGINAGSYSPSPYTDFQQAAFEIGRRSGSSDELNGWLDEVRVINGTGLYVSDFVPPTEEYGFHRVTLLCGFNGVDGATTFTSEDRFEHTVNFNGNAELDTAQKKFGTASVYLPGTTGDYLAIPVTASPEGDDWCNFGAGDWTIEAFIRYESIATDTLFSQWNGSSERALLLQKTTTGYNCYIGRPSTLQIGNSSTMPHVAALNTWYHTVFQREGSVFTMFIDGVPIGQTTNIASEIQHASQEDFNIGVHNSGTSNTANCWMDEVRVSKFARYPGSPAGFVVPTSEYPRV